MKEIKKIQKGNKTLLHNRYRDDYGILINSITITQYDEMGFGRTEFVMPPIKAKLSADYDNIVDSTNEYTDYDYALMFLTK